ncbi:AAA family ATPase [Krasilnikovia sp. MM14-A1259]|uniref:MinD/ParA family ATP-binding protein n=1 Tax=Krasilnikovia sp. MM14-A1259 TaxID=3373539 RepID=UPI00382408E3
MDGTETGWGRPAEPAPRWRALLDRARHGSRTADDTEGADHDESAEAYRPAPGTHPMPSRPVSPPERRPFNPLDPRHQADQRPPEQPRPASEPRPVNPFDRRPVNPLDRRVGRTADPRPVSPAEPRPVNPLDSRRQSRLADGFGGRADGGGSRSDDLSGRFDGFATRADGLAPRAEGYAGRAEAEQQHSFFNPATRAVPPPIARVLPENGYPAARAAAAVGPASVLPPPAPVAPRPAPPVVPAPAPPAPVLPAPAPAAPTSPAGARIEWRQARPDEDLERAVAVMRRKLGTPRVLAFANPKGGVHKTTATVLAAATIGSVRGRGVLAWDDNELRGTLGLRAGSARHARTIRHLIADLLTIENMHGEELLSELDDYLRHASDGSYDVLAGEENPRFAQRLDQHTVRRVMDLLRRTHDVICVDTGNNVESVNWQTVMKAADQLVITTVPREDAAFTADWMLDLLDDTGMGDIVANAVTLISCPSPGKLPLLDDLTKHFATRTRAVAVVPYDPALEVGSSIEYGDLQPETRAAWLRAAAVMIEPFAQ